MYLLGKLANLVERAVVEAVYVPEKIVRWGNLLEEGLAVCGKGSLVQYVEIFAQYYLGSYS